MAWSEFEMIKDSMSRRSRCGTAETNPTSNHEVAGSILGLAQWVKDLAWLWLWLWLRLQPAAVAPVRPLAWETPYATGSALKRQKKKKKKKKRKKDSMSLRT